MYIDKIEHIDAVKTQLKKMYGAVSYTHLPYGEKESRKSIYAIADNMFRFWYRFIPDLSLINI